MALYQELFEKNDALYTNLEKLSEVTGNCHNVGWPIKLTNGDVKWRPRNLYHDEDLTIRHLTGSGPYSEKALNEPKFQERIKNVEQKLENTTKKIYAIIQIIDSILPDLE